MTLDPSLLTGISEEYQVSNHEFSEPWEKIGVPEVCCTLGLTQLCKKSRSAGCQGRGLTQSYLLQFAAHEDFAGVQKTTNSRRLLLAWVRDSVSIQLCVG